MDSAFVSSSFLGLTRSSISTSPYAQSVSTRPTPFPKQSLNQNALVMSGANVLIVNSKGGGHGHIGLHLAEKLLSEGNNVHIHQIGNETSSQPIKQYPSLKQKYSDQFTVEYSDSPPSSIQSTYSHIYDNNAKSQEDIQSVIDYSKANNTKLFYISSAGSYKYDKNVAPHEITNSASGATIDVENVLVNENVSNINFRPIYIIGPHTSKREYIDYFFDRLSRNRPILLPGTGDELTSITDVRDIASLLALAIDSDLSNNIINCCNVRAITFNGMVKLCAKVMNIEDPKVINYDPSKMESAIDGFKVKKAFPFRPRHFFANPVQAQLLLGWKPTYSGTEEGLTESLKTCYEEYVQLGLDKADVDFSLDDKIIANL